MKCAQCSMATEKPGWIVSQVGRHIVLKKQGGDFYKYGLDLYTDHSRRGQPTFTARAGRKVLSPSLVIKFGDAHCYWLTKLFGDKRFCSRACANDYAAEHNYVLIRRSDGAQIAPEQKVFDEYARDHRLEHVLALINDDDWNTPEKEFVGLLSARLQSPKRLVSLAFTLIDEGKTSLAERAVSKLRSEFSLLISSQNSAAILFRLEKFDAIDALYQELASALGGIEHVAPRIKSTWAFYLISCDPGKAIRLSEDAVKAQPNESTIIENHLAILCDRQPEAAVRFFRENQFRVKDDIGFLAVGKALLRLGQLSEAEEKLRLAALIEPDPMTALFLAETLYRMGRSPETLLLCREVTSSLDQHEQDQPKDFDGGNRNPVHYPYRQKKYLRRVLLAVEGKCLIQVGEDESGRERIQDSLEIGPDVEADNGFFEGIESAVEGFRTRTKLEEMLAIQQQKLVELVTAKKKADSTVKRLSDLVSAVANTQAEWEGDLLRLKDEASVDEVAEHYLSKIHSFCVLISRRDLNGYQLAKNAVETSFPHLPLRAVEQLANAEFLLSSHKDEGLPIYAGVIIEYSKALETAVNEIVISCFVRARFHQFARAIIEVPSARDSRKAVELKFRGNPKPLALGELCLVLQCCDNQWTEFCDSYFGPRAGWIRTHLPSTLRRVKDDFRNGCAHSSSGSRRKAMELKEFLNKSEVFRMLEQLTCAAPGSPDSDRGIKRVS